MFSSLTSSGITISTCALLTHTTCMAICMAAVGTLHASSTKLQRICCTPSKRGKGGNGAHLFNALTTLQTRHAPRRQGLFVQVQPSQGSAGGSPDQVSSSAPMHLEATLSLAICTGPSGCQSQAHLINRLALYLDPHLPVAPTAPQGRGHGGGVAGACAHTRALCHEHALTLAMQPSHACIGKGPARHCTARPFRPSPSPSPGTTGRHCNVKWLWRHTNA